MVFQTVPAPAAGGDAPRATRGLTPRRSGEAHGQRGERAQRRVPGPGRRAGELDTRRALDELLEEHRRLDPRELRAEAEVDARAEREVVRGVAIDEEPVGVGVAAR